MKNNKKQDANFYNNQYEALKKQGYSKEGLYNQDYNIDFGGKNTFGENDLLKAIRRSRN